MRTAHISSFNVPTLIINRTLIDFGMYISPSHKPGLASVLCLLVSLHWREKKKNPRRRMRARIVRALTNFHAKDACPRVLTRVSETEGNVRSFARTRASRERTRRRVGCTPLTPGSLRFSARYPAVRKALFSPPYVGTHARARTHRRRRRRIAVGVHAHGRETPPRLKILSAGACWSEEPITREAVHSAPSPDCRSRE